MEILCESIVGFNSVQRSLSYPDQEYTYILNIISILFELYFQHNFQQIKFGSHFKSKNVQGAPCTLPHTRWYKLPR